MRVPPSLVLAGAVLAAGCAGTPESPETLVVSRREALDEDLALRISDQLALLEKGVIEPEDPFSLMNRLEHMLPSWQEEQRQQQAEPIESVLTQKVVVNFDTVAKMLVEAPHERRVVAAWALGFSRVPPNGLGVASRHLEAVEVLTTHLEGAPDDLVENSLVALWVLGEPTTPLAPLLDLASNHHKPEVRANATLALSSILRPATLNRALDAVLVALEDPHPTVRLHAASIARRLPDGLVARRLVGLLGEEQVPLVRARMAMALGACAAAGMIDPSQAGPALLPLLASSESTVAEGARWALIETYGEDLGPEGYAWAELVHGPVIRG